ncbi:hypothetical protein B0O99DRAFT_719569 [Bisporella sp. PMI_857]|nr:hypothetical protein B0O99DRAFT_719569 [Bisporella sp. PMI_857]
MKSIFLLVGTLFALVHSHVSSLVNSPRSATAPSGCRKLITDDDWPTPETWRAAIPGVVPSNGTDGIGRPIPNYRIRAQSVEDVQAAVRFASANNIRLTVITTGHDQIGRSDAASGLIIDLSLLDKVQVLDSFYPTTEGVPSPNFTYLEPNVITPIEGVTAAVTFGPAVVGLALNYAVSPSGLFTVSGGAAGVAVSGGWGQNGGYGPLTAQYGLGVDQWLEAKIVTPDGQLLIANNVSNTDLFWAIRGGGGGTFGVVIQSTWKAHRAVPITGYNWYLNSTITGSNVSNTETGEGPVSHAMAYLLGQLPRLQDEGISGTIYANPSNVRGFMIHPGNQAGIKKANQIWGPILTKMQSFENMTPFQTRPFEFANYREFFEETYGIFEPEIGPDTPPYNRGIMPYDSRLLAAEHVQSPNITYALRGCHNNYGVMFQAPGQSQGDGRDTSANPGWRKAVANYQQQNWWESFWGENYQRLSEIKNKYDPNMTFWETPGINAHYMQAIDGRACLVLPAPEVPSLQPPLSDRSYLADLAVDGPFLYGNLELIGKHYPAPASRNLISLITNVEIYANELWKLLGARPDRAGVNAWWLKNIVRFSALQGLSQEEREQTFLTGAIQISGTKF